jgi:hypothetical protein
MSVNRPDLGKLRPTKLIQSKVSNFATLKVVLISVFFVDSHSGDSGLGFDNRTSGFYSSRVGPLPSRFQCHDIVNYTNVAFSKKLAMISLLSLNHVLRLLVYSRSTTLAYFMICRERNEVL